MKKLFTLFAVLSLSVAAYSQNEGISGCNDPSGGIQIHFDYSKNCSSAPGSLAGMSEIGFHSGANQWAKVYAAASSGSIRGINNGNDTFVVYIPDVQLYYNLAAPVENIYFVFNQYPSDPADQWGSEGKDKDNDSNGSCDDFFIVLEDISSQCDETAAVSIDRLRIDLKLKVSPNPISNQAEISFANPQRQAFAIQLLNTAGQVVRSYQDVRSEQLSLERGELPAGIYQVMLINEKGERASTPVLLK